MGAQAHSVMWDQKCGHKALLVAFLSERALPRGAVLLKAGLGLETHSLAHPALQLFHLHPQLPTDLKMSNPQECLQMKLRCLPSFTFRLISKHLLCLLSGRHCPRLWG